MLTRTSIKNISSVDVLVTILFALMFTVSVIGSVFLIYFATRQLGEALEPEIFQTTIEGKGTVSYYMHFYSETHSRAAARCERGNMKLVSVTSELEDVFLTSELRKRTRWLSGKKNATNDSEGPAVAYWWISAYEKKSIMGSASNNFQWESSKLSMGYSNFCEDERNDLFTPSDRNKPRPLAKLIINSDKEVQGKASGCWSQRNRAASYDWEGQRSPFIFSNEVPEHPVVSPVSGSVFERRLIEKYIADNGVDPTNGKEITVDQLIEIKIQPIVKPKVPSATSIPAVLKSLQDEWDAVMLNSFTLRQQLQTARQELSHALYQHDAACRVIARLHKEVSTAREALSTLKPHTGYAAVTAPTLAASAEAGGVAAQPVEAAGLTPEIISQLQDKATILTQDRKRRGKTMPEGLATSEAVKSYKTLASHPGLHSASMPGILTMDVHAADPSHILTGGNDRCATVFNKDTEQVVAVLKGHTKKVTKALYHPEEEVAITASPDSTIRVWNITNSSQSAIIRAHDGPVTGLSLHATGEYVLSTSLDQHWAFSDIRVGRLLTKVADADNVPLTTAQFHPDGLIFGTGTQDSQIKIWDLKEQSNVANFPGHSGPIAALSFSENGYYLATAAEDSCVKLWDLRKLKNFKTIQLEEGYQVKDLCFDQSGTYLALAGTDVRIYLCKQWETLKTFNDHTALAMGVRFGNNAQCIASVSMDRTLKVYGTE